MAALTVDSLSPRRKKTRADRKLKKGQLVKGQDAYNTSRVPEDITDLYYSPIQWLLLRVIILETLEKFKWYLCPLFRKIILNLWIKGDRIEHRPLEDSSGYCTVKPSPGGGWAGNHLPLNVIFKLFDSEFILFRLPPPGFLLFGSSSRYSLQQPFFPKHFGLWEGEERTDGVTPLAHSLRSILRAGAVAGPLRSSPRTAAFPSSPAWLPASFPPSPRRAVYSTFSIIKKSLKTYRKMEETV